MVTATPKRSIFRDKALQKYVQNQEKSTLPRLIAPPVFLLCWFLLIVLTIAGLVAWWEQVPLYVSESGVILDSTVLPDQGSDEAVAVMLLPTKVSETIRAGFPTQVQIGQAGPQVACLVTAVSPGVLSPSEIHQHYGLSVTDPSQVIAIRLGTGISRRVYAGSPIRAQIRVGSRHLITLFPLLNNLLEDV